MKRFLIIVFVVFFANAYSQYYRNGCVSSADELASEVGIKILKDGGNAIDAAVGVGFALSVVYPQAGNIGGGGFMVIHFVGGKNTSIDYREKAPSLASRDMYLDASGNVIEDLSTTGHIAVGVPGSVAGMLYALEKYGTMSRADVMKYAIDFAENGFTGSKYIFGKKFKGGDVFIQKDLANTLKEIRDKGRDGFYKGRVADLFIAEMKRGSGLISYSDLEKYDVIERDVLKGTYRGYDIITMGPPSSGGICLLYLLNLVEYFDLKATGFGTAGLIHLFAEAMRRVYADRSEFMGDADFVNVPVDILISKQYAKRRLKDFDEYHASLSDNVKHGDAYYREHQETTHYSIVDKWGNCIAVTTTLNDNFGSKLVVDGAGFLLNDEMDDFSSKPGVPNMYGLLGSEANSIAANKRMLSAMTPTIIFKDGKPFLVLGSPGGGKIITSVFQTVVNVIDFDMRLKRLMRYYSMKTGV
ncbi:MAG: gamma-glutamyltransferase family protein [Ignavibacteriae bacterium]|nr:gamma-glutamyltransferase family protein [Ignavibacteriota bacterium]